MLPLILCPESVCLPQAGITACPLYPRTEQAVNVKTFPEGGYSVNGFRGLATTPALLLWRMSLRHDSWAEFC